MRQPNSKILSKISELILVNNQYEILLLVKKLHHADLADIIADMEINDANYLFQLLKPKTSSLVLIELEEDLREFLLSSLSSQEIAEEIIENLESDDATDIISSFSESKKNEILSFIEDNRYVKKIKKLLSYSKESAGSAMATELIKVNENWDSNTCLKEMKTQSKNIKKVHAIYVVNNNDILVGSLSLKKLLITENNSIVKDISDKEIISVNVNENKEKVAQLMNKYNLVAIPVIDNEGKLIGRITIDDAMDLFKEESEKDYQMASGISKDVELSDNIWQLIRARSPWLLIGLCGGLLAAYLIEITLNSTKKEILELVFFIPLIAAMAGNAGIQSSAIVVQGLANYSIQNNNIIHKLGKEFIVSLANSLICSLLIFSSMLLLNYNLELSITVSTSLIAVIIFASLFGTLVPLILNKFKIDPALATGPFVTTINDILGLVIYFLLAKIII
ncbi:MAG: magnesium transporter [Flavobacteriales bacterium]|nr:magnesium transporter [Flavobacteriales bacterium]